MASVIAIFPTRICSHGPKERCANCRGKSAVSSSPVAHLDLSDSLKSNLLDGIRLAKRNGSVSVVVSGITGEPTMYKDLPGLLRFLASTKTDHITLLTNGWPFLEERRAQEFIGMIKDSMGGSLPKLTIWMSTGDPKAGAGLGKILPHDDPRVVELRDAAKRLQSLAASNGIRHNFVLHGPYDNVPPDHNKTTRAYCEKYGLPTVSHRRSKMGGVWIRGWNFSFLFKERPATMELLEGGRRMYYGVRQDGMVYYGSDGNFAHPLGNLHQEPFFGIHERFVESVRSQTAKTSRKK